MVTETSSSITRFEEWFFMMEFLWGRTIFRWRDTSSPTTFQAQEARLREVFDRKFLQIIKVRNSQSMYATHTEDIELRGST